MAGLVLAGQVRAGLVGVGPSSAELLREIETLHEGLRLEHKGRLPSAIPGLEPARALYRAFGIDPTRLRPSSEALLRRVLDDKPWPRISNAVDLGNLCALRFLLPIGLYDAARVSGRVTLRRGFPGEVYRGVRKDEVRLEGRPVLADEEGAFGNPTADSLRTAVTEHTETLWMVVFAPGAYERERLGLHLDFACRAIGRHLARANEACTVESSV